jgi:copper oxidase (laccase) domain-containing protein
MLGLGARRERVRAAIGPCIHQPAYEVGPEFEARFDAADPQNRRFFTASGRTGHWQFDLPGYVVHRLRQTGIDQVEDMGICTYSKREEFFSYRRTTHLKEPDYGRELSAIVLEQ